MLQTGDRTTERLSKTTGSGSSRWRWLRRALPVLVLAVVILWASAALRRIGGPDGAAEVASSIGNVGNVGNVGNPAGQRITAAPEAPEPALHGPLRGLAELRVLYRQPGGGERIDTLSAGALRANRVTVFNLWATFCQPCKEEFPGLDELLESEDPEKSLEHVDFVPVLVDNGASIEHARVVYDRLGGPPTRAFVADEGLSGGFRGVLTEAELIDSDLSLPMTLVLGCDAHLRWFHRGALTGAKFQELAALLQELDAEVGSDVCPRPRRSKKKKKTKRAGSASSAGKTSDSAGSDSDSDSGSADSNSNSNSDSADSDSAGAGSDSAGESAAEPGAASEGVSAGSGSDGESAGAESGGACDDDRKCEPQRGENSVTCPTDCRPEISGDLSNLFGN